jgi:regulator of sigma E protease
MQIIAAIFVFAVLILIHELGHFLMAKRAGVRVEEFAIGFPPRLFSFKRGETTYSINALPLGGYVRMPGENGETTDADGNYDPRTFSAQSAGKRALILVAGVTMNMLLAWAIYTGIYGIAGVPQPVVGSVQSGTPAQQIGLQSGDRILSVDGHSVMDSGDVEIQVLGALLSTKSANVPVTLVIQRGHQQLTLTPSARRNPPANEGRIGFAFSGTFAHVPWWQVPALGFHYIGQDFQQEGLGIQGILVGAISPGDAVSGPVGIVKATGDAASAGFVALLGFMAFLSWNLAVVNILPIPGLDGGRLLILGIEVLRRGKRLAPEREAFINLAGILVLLSFIAVVTINDISHLVTGR